MPLPKLRLGNKLLLLSVLLVLIPIGVAGRILIRITQDELKSFANDELVLVAEQLASDIDDFVQASCLGPLLLLRAVVDDPAMGPEEKIRALQGIEAIPDVVALQITAEGAGKPILIAQNEFSSRLQAAGLDASAVLLLEEGTVASRRPQEGLFAGDVTWIRETDDWLLTLVLPLKQPILDRPAALSARVDLGRMRRRLAEHQFNRTGRIVLVDGDGRRLLGSEPPQRQAGQLAETAVAMLASGSRAAGAQPYTDPVEGAMLGAYALPATLDWAVLVDRSEATAYAAIGRMKESLYLWVMIGLAAAVGGAFVFSRRMSRPIVEIGRVAEAVGEGDFEQRVTERGSGDEIAGLGRQINLMIEGLVERERVKSENVVLQELTERLRNLNEQKNQFLGMAAHDLRNPIGAIQGYAEMLLEEELDEELHSIVSQIVVSSRFMLRLLNDLLDIAKIESGKLDLRLEPTDLTALVSQNAELNRIIASKKNIAVELATTDHLPPIVADAAKIEQVLNNLISNAIKFSHADTVIRVELERRDGEIFVSVTDQGQGIPEDELPKIFKEFQKTSVKSTAGEKSTGLGLAIARRIIEGHGGQIGVRSQVGEGSTFFFSLPTDAPSASPDSPDAANP